MNSVLCVLCLVIQAGISLSENASGRTGYSKQVKPSYNLQNKADQHTAVKGIINIDELPQNDQVEGSGASRDDTESGSGLGPDDEDGEGESGSGVSVVTFGRTEERAQGYSALELDLDANQVSYDEVQSTPNSTVTNRELTKCERMRNNAKNYGDRNLIGAFLPDCKPNGDFKEEQCDTARGECWCVDRHGTEVKYTRKRMPYKPNCERVYDDNLSMKDDVNTGYQTSPRDTRKKEVQPEPETTDPPKAETTPRPEKNKDAYEDETDKGKDGTDYATKNGQAAASTAFMASPGILAGIIGGTIVGLLCAILLVLFIVYRMRKKDEGSYALDEPKHSPSMHSYQRAPAREFYA